MRETHRLVAVGWKGSSKPFRHYLLFFTCQKERVRTVGECVSGRGACWSSERSEEEAEAPLIFSPCRAPPLLADIWPHTDHSYLQTGRRRRSGAPRSLRHRRITHPLLSILSTFCAPSLSLLFPRHFFSSPPLSSSSRPPPPPSSDFPPPFLSLTLHHFIFIFSK